MPKPMPPSSSKPETRSEAMKRAWATRRANATAQADPEIETASVEQIDPAITDDPAGEAATDRPSETDSTPGTDPASVASVQADSAPADEQPDISAGAVVTQTEMAVEPELMDSTNATETQAAVAADPTLEPVPAAQPESALVHLDSVVQPISIVVQPDSVEAWTEHPVCLCGCGCSLPRSKSEARQSLFKVGHDARLKSLAARVIKGTASCDEIRAITRALQERIGFLKTRPELAAAFR
jgi:hypothetical protein